jgi:hypothetical protein
VQQIGTKAQFRIGGTPRIKGHETPGLCPGTEATMLRITTDGDEHQPVEIVRWLRCRHEGC